MDGVLPATLCRQLVPSIQLLLIGGRSSDHSCTHKSMPGHQYSYRCWVMELRTSLMLQVYCFPSTTCNVSHTMHCSVRKLVHPTRPRWRKYLYLQIAVICTTALLEARMKVQLAHIIRTSHAQRVAACCQYNFKSRPIVKADMKSHPT
jgi:hypothetical protein